MKEQIISFETAKLAKEAGFNGFCYDCYNVYGNLYSDGWCEYLDDADVPIPFTKKYLSLKDVLAPTQSLFQKWLYEKYGIFIELIWIDTLSDLFCYHISTTNNTTRPNSRNIRDPFICLEEGLKEAVQLIPKNKNYENIKNLNNLKDIKY